MVTRINKYNFLENPRIGYDQTHLAFECYWAIRLHFITEHYDFFKYQGKTTMSSRDGMNSYFNDRERTIRGTNNNWCPERTVLYRIGKHLHNPYARDSSGVFDCYSFFVYQFINGIENLHDMNTEDWQCFRRNKMKDNQDHDFDNKSWIKWKDRLSIQFWKISFKRELEEIKDSLNDYEYDHSLKKNMIVGHSSFNSLFEIDGINHPKIFKLYMDGTISIETIILLDSVLVFVMGFNQKLIDPIWRDFKTKFDKYIPIYLWLMHRNSDWWKNKSDYVGEDIQSEVKKITASVFTPEYQSMSKTLLV